MLMLQSTHGRIVTEKDAEIARLMTRLGKANADLIAEEMVAQDRLVQIRKLIAQLTIVGGKLSKFTAPRARDAKGHFLPLKARVQV